MINWLHDQIIIDSTIFDRIFTSNSVLISFSSDLPPTFRRAGYLHVEVLIDGIYFTAQRIKIEFGNSLISIPFASYRLSFKPVTSLLTNYQNTSIKIAEFNNKMQVEQPIGSLPKIGEDIYTTVIPSQANAQFPVFIITSPLARRAARITNQTNKGLYIKCGAAANPPTLLAGDPFTLIPAGGSYTFEDYGGEIVGIMAANFSTGGKIIVIQSPYITQ